MTPMIKIKQFIDNLDEKDFQKYAVVALVIILALFGVLAYRSYSAIATLKKRNGVVNQSRRKVKEILTEYELVQQQQKYVEDILLKTKDFKIVSEFDQILASLGLSNAKTQDSEPNAEDVLEGYSEIKLLVTLTGLNTKQLADLLLAIEKQERMYTKELEVEKNSDNNLTVKITVATLEKKSETAQATE